MGSAGDHILFRRQYAVVVQYWPTFRYLITYLLLYWFRRISYPTRRYERRHKYLQHQTKYWRQLSHNFRTFMIDKSFFSSFNRLRHRDFISTRNERIAVLLSCKSFDRHEWLRMPIENKLIWAYNSTQYRLVNLWWGKKRDSAYHHFMVATMDDAHWYLHLMVLHIHQGDTFIPLWWKEELNAVAYSPAYDVWNIFPAVRCMGVPLKEN